MFSKNRILTLIATFAILIVMTATLASAGAPDVVGITGNPPSTIFTTDGSSTEWGTLGSTNPYWFASTCTGGGGGSTTCPNPNGDLYLSFTCTTNTLNVLFVAKSGTYAVNDSTNNWISIGGVNNKVVNDGIPYTTNTSPNMWRDLGTNDGYEAAVKYGIVKNNPTSTWAPGGSYTVNFHAFVDGVTSGTNDITVNIPCQPTAVTLSGFQAQTESSVSNHGNLAGIATLGGILVLAGLLSVWYLGFRRS